MLHDRQRGKSSISGRLCVGRECRVFRFNPAQQNTVLFRIRGDHIYAPGRRQESDRRRVDDLKNVKAEGVKQNRREKESSDGESSPLRSVPIKNEDGVGCAHCGKEVASETEVIPRSKDRFVTATTSA